MIPLTNSRKREFDTQLFRGISCLLTKIKDKLTTITFKKDSLYAVFLSSVREKKGRLRQKCTGDENAYKKTFDVLCFCREITFQ